MNTIKNFKNEDLTEETLESLRLSIHTNGVFVNEEPVKIGDVYYNVRAGFGGEFLFPSYRLTELAKRKYACEKMTVVKIEGEKVSLLPVGRNEEEVTIIICSCGERITIREKNIYSITGGEKPEFEGALVYYFARCSSCNASYQIHAESKEVINPKAFSWIRKLSSSCDIEDGQVKENCCGAWGGDVEAYDSFPEIYKKGLKEGILIKEKNEKEGLTRVFLNFEAKTFEDVIEYFLKK